MSKKVAAPQPVEGRWALPDGWSWHRARDIAKIVGGSTPKNAADTTNYSEDGTPWLTPADLSGYSKPTIDQGRRNLAPHVVNRSSLLPAGAVLISSRAPVGYCAVASNPMVTNQGFRSLILADHLDPFFVRYYVLFSRKYLEDHASGTTFKELSGSALGDLVFPVPPLDVQRRIVARIDELFAEIDDGEAALARARDDLAMWRKALLKAAVTGELTADWRAANPAADTGADLLGRVLADRRASWEAHARNKGKRYKEPEQPDLGLFRYLPALPSGWAWASIAQLTSLVTSGSRGWAEYYSDAGAFFIRAQNINTDRLCLDGVAHVSPPSGGEGTRTKVSKGDLLITITGANVTKSALVDVALEEAYVSQHVGLVRPMCERLAAFLYWWVVTPAGGRAILERLAYGAGKPGLNLPNLLGLPVPLPPLDEQREITRLCASVDEERSSCVEVNREWQVAAAALRQSILAAAFRGELA